MVRRVIETGSAARFGAGRPERFVDRQDAGQRLAAAMAGRQFYRPIVLALPRGGVPVGFEIAQALGAPLDVVLVRKIGAPGNPEYGLGALVDGEPPTIVLNDEAVRYAHASESYIEAEKQRQIREIERRRQLYGLARRLPSIEGRTAIVVDDGVATGGTAQAALEAISLAGASRVVLAVPVAPPDVLQNLARHADEVICLSSPPLFRSVGEHYEQFAQTPDHDVLAILKRARDTQPDINP